jgi:hypothetical protein
MMNDPVVQILREAAARGRQLRLARECATQNETRSGGNVSEARLADPLINVALTSQHDANAVEKESLP